MKMKLLVNDLNIKFLVISFGSFAGSILVINILNHFIQDPKISSKLTIILIFVYNFYFLKKVFKIKKNNKLFLLLLSLSVIFRFFEYWIFLSMFNLMNNINIAWITTISLSFVIKYFLYPYSLSKLEKK
tara:strand:- start:1748 stop:2134 length:387 start_codon:yes stop_codon:yes gene_type:complete